MHLSCLFVENVLPLNKFIRMQSYTYTQNMTTTVEVLTRRAMVEGTKLWLKRTHFQVMDLYLHPDGSSVTNE